MLKIIYKGGRICNSYGKCNKKRREEGHAIKGVIYRNKEDIINGGLHEQLDKTY